MLVMVACQAPVVPQTPTTAPPTPTASVRVATPSPPASRPSATAPATTASRVDALNAADAAFRGGDLKTAAGLYERVANTPPGSTEGPATPAIDDFAHFRAMLALLSDGREDEARTQLDALQRRDATAPLARLGNQLWDQYGMTGQVRGACAQLQPQIASQAGPVLATLQGIGVAVDAPTLCAGPRS
jgi:hypothetical protein